MQKLVHQCHSGTSVHIIIAIDQDALFPAHGIIESVHSYIHILHEEWIDEVGQLGTEKALGGRFGGDTSPVFRPV